MGCSDTTILCFMKMLSLLVLLFIVGLLPVLQTVQPEIEGEMYADLGLDVTLKCQWIGSGTFSRMEWRTSVMNQTDYFDAGLQVRYSPLNSVMIRDPEHYSFDKDDPGYPLTVKNFTPDDEARYWCKFDPSFASFFDLFKRVPPTSIHLSDSTGDYSSDGRLSYVVEGEGRQYTCQVPDINPEATFSWTVGSQPLTADDIENDVGANRLITSRSMVTLTATWSNHGEIVKCQASNKDGNPGISISVTLDVKVPPKSSAMSLLDSSGGSLGDPVDVFQGIELTLSCRVQGTRPAATIRWFLNDVEQTTTTTTPGVGNGLVDTEGDWTFTLERVNHKQMVKCEANTAESETPFPSVSTTLNVIGPADIPVISGSMTMTENVATILTCTADLGYPDDWTLEWSNEGTAIGNPSDTTTALSGTSQRYMFTSHLEFTPNRQDNTHNIKCTANKDSWTSSPLPEQTWGPINVQYVTNITNKNNTYVGIRSGLTANMSCVAKGNPAPVITWFDPNNTEITNGGDDNKYMVEVSYVTFDSDMTSGYATISKLTIQAVDPEVDYGVYTCYSTNGIGRPDSHEIIIDGTRGPNKPTGVVMTDRTSSSIAVRWTAGYHGGETQWFHVSHETSDPSEIFSDRIKGGVTTYNVTGLKYYTQYEIRVYAENDVERNPNPGSIVEYTLPVTPSSDMGFSLLYNSIEGTVIIEGLNAHGGCIQLEVKYEGTADWVICGHCIATDGNVDLSFWCLQTRKRRRRAAGDVEVVRASLCQMNGQLCSDPIGVMEVQNPVTDPPAPSSTGVIVGVAAGVISLAVIVLLLGMFFRRKFKNRNGPEQVNLTLQRKQRNREYIRKESEATSVYQEVQGADAKQICLVSAALAGT